MGVRQSVRPIRKNDPQGLRARVLDMAADLFQVRGYFTTSMQDLMQEAEVSGGALHHHFASKKVLAMAVIRERIAPAVRETWINPLRAAPSLQRAIADVFTGIVANAASRGRIAGCPLNNIALELALSDADFREAINTVFAEWQAALAERIGATRGGIRLSRSKRRDAATFIITAYSGAMTLAKTSQSAAPLRSVAGALASWIRSRGFVR